MLSPECKIGWGGRGGCFKFKINITVLLLQLSWIETDIHAICRTDSVSLTQTITEMLFHRSLKFSTSVLRLCLCDTRKQFNGLPNHTREESIPFSSNLASLAWKTRCYPQQLQCSSFLPCFVCFHGAQWCPVGTEKTSFLVNIQK